MDKNDTLGEVTIGQFLDAQHVIGQALIYIARNMDNKDESMKEKIRGVFAMIALDNIMQSPIREMIARELADQIEREKEGKKDITKNEAEQLALFKTPSVKS